MSLLPAFLRKHADVPASPDRAQAETRRQPATIVRAAPPWSPTFEPFLLSLASATAWCLARVDVDRPGESLRDPDIRPRTLESDYLASVSTVLGARRGPAGWKAAHPAADLRGGALVVYFPDADLSDGAAELESRGFFDVFNCPPWGTWVGFWQEEPRQGSYSAYLAAWVPPPLLDAAARGIAANPERCIQWLGESPTALALHLRASAYAHLLDHPPSA